VDDFEASVDVEEERVGVDDVADFGFVEVAGVGGARELAGLAGIAQSTISAIETDRVKLGAERAKTLARALKVHPAVLLFPGWRTGDESAA
jgi:transcriptional regulator with XRE-family HTH domain